MRKEAIGQLTISDVRAEDAFEETIRGKHDGGFPQIELQQAGDERL